MENFGKLQIYSNKELPLGFYEYGISQPNQTDPYLWGGQLIVIQNGDDYQLFSGLVTGMYRWFVRRSSDRVIVSSNYSEVIVATQGFSAQNVEDLINYKLSTAKGAELAGIMQGELYNTMLRTIKAQPSYQFFKESELGSTLGLALVFSTEKEVLKVFSYAGVLLRGGIGTFAEGFAPVDIYLGDTLDYVIDKGVPNRISFNPNIFNEIIDFSFFCKETKYKNYSMDDFLASGQLGGFGNDENDSIDIIDNYIISLQD